MKKALVVGGNSGIGLAIVLSLIAKGYEHVYIVGKDKPCYEDIPRDKRKEFENSTSFFQLDLTLEDYSVFDRIQDIEMLIITAGFGRVTLFENLTAAEVKNLVKCNELAVIQIIKNYYIKLKSNENFDCAIMVSIAGHVASPFFSVYGATKAGLAAFIENVNVELEAEGFSNRILDISPGALKGTAFAGDKNDVTLVDDIAKEIIERAKQKEKIYIPAYEEVYKGVLERYHADATEFGLQSYKYKVANGRISSKPQIVVGYLSGTFDLFHIGHLNLIARARRQCDYLIVGVHDSGDWKGKRTMIPFEERKAIVGSIRYVDKVVMSPTEDDEAWRLYHYDKLFVGSDYKGSERFARYERYFAENKTGVEIVYFERTPGISSTQLREGISFGKDNN